MITEGIRSNSATLREEMNWFSQVLHYRMREHAGSETEVESVIEIEPPELEDDPSMMAEVIRHYEMNFAERLVLVLAIIPEVAPELLDPLFTINERSNRGFTEFGGYQGQQHTGFLPTAETAVFILAGDLVEHRIELRQLFAEDHFFHHHGILELEQERDGEPLMSGALRLSREYLEFFTAGTHYEPRFTMKFPARRITTGLTWDELILEGNIKDQLEEIRGWIKYGDILMNDWGLDRKIKPGFRALFYGKSGTGKTLAATLLGQDNGLPVYRVDLSSLISKYIGETEKNLASLFDQARNKKWVLFFDEADALFGQRTEARSSNDRSANQQVAYLLQRVEDFPGVAILASNLRKNIDPAFTRRFDCMIGFPMPGPQQRLTIWKNNFERGDDGKGKKKKPYYQLAKDVDLKFYADNYELSGGNIINVLRHSCIRAISDNTKVIANRYILGGVENELRKLGKSI